MANSVCDFKNPVFRNPATSKIRHSEIRKLQKSGIKAKEFTGYHISCEKAALYELIEHAKSENGLSVEKKDIDDWLEH